MSAPWRDKLIGYLHRVFDVDAHGEPMLRVRHEQWCAWTVADDQLTLDSATGQRYIFALNDYTLASLAAAIEALPGFSGVALADDASKRSASVLIASSGRQDQSNGDTLYGYRSLLWALLHAMGKGLADASADVDLAIDQVYMARAGGEWLDLHGSYYSIVRALGELDEVYLARLIAEILLPRSNNVAVAMALQTLFDGEPGTVVVVDAPVQTYDPPLESGHTAGYGLFDVLITEPPRRDITLESLQAALDAFRAAGTYMRHATITFRLGPRAIGIAAAMTSPASVSYAALSAGNDQVEGDFDADVGIASICSTPVAVAGGLFLMPLRHIDAAFVGPSAIAATLPTPVIVRSAHFHTRQESL